MMITEYKSLCLLCGAQAAHTHHLVFGRGIRPLADKSALTAPLCGRCHERIHTVDGMGTMSKIIGQLEWEKQAVEKGNTPDKAREMFRKEFGRSWL